MDRIAQDLALDPVDVRRRNLLPDDGPRPITAHGGARVDIGLLGPQFEQLLDEFGYDAWRLRQHEARADGRYVGIAVSMLVQGGAPTQYGVAGRFGSWEVAAVSVLPDGSVTVAVGTKSQGQAHETTLAQVAADVLGVDDGATVSEGDTAALPYGMGSWGSRTAVMAGGAVTRVRGAPHEDGRHRRAHAGRPAPSPGSPRSPRRRGGTRTASPRAWTPASRRRSCTRPATRSRCPTSVDT